MCLSHLIYTERPCLIHTCHAAPKPSPTVPFFSRPQHSTAVESGRVGYLSSASSGYHAEFHEVPIRRIPISDAGGQYETKHRLSWTRKRVVAAHYKKKDDLLTLWTSSSNISGYHAYIHEEHGTVGAGQGRGMAWVRHDMCESALKVYCTWISSQSIAQ
jgi:hypothetical protein